MHGKQIPNPADSPDLYSCARLMERMVAEGEDPRLFKALYDEIYAEWRPRTVTEWFFFESMLRARWNLPRIDRMEVWLYAVIGRALWQNADEEDLRRILGAARFRQVSAGLKRIAGGRKRKASSIKLAEQSLKRLRQERERQQSDPDAREDTEARRRLVDLKPGSGLIQ